MRYKFLIYISYSYAIPIGTPLEKEILKRGDNVMWFSDSENGKTALKTKSNVFSSIKNVIDYQPDIVLTIANNVPDFITGVKVQVFHGFNAEKRPSKKNISSHFRIRGFFDLYCTQGPTTTTEFERLQKKHKYFDVIETGWSKVDSLFPIESESEKKKPTILISSTFTKKLSLSYDNEIYDEIKRLSENGKYQLMMILHPKTSRDIKQKWIRLNNENFTFYDTTDIIPILKKADVMLADTTSVIQEFLLQIKPVVTYKHAVNHNYLLNISHVSDLEPSLIKAFEYPDKLIQNIRYFVSQLHPYNDGKSSKRLIDATIKFLHQDKAYLKTKPLNLIRKYKIRRKLNFYTLKTYSKSYTIKKTK